MVAKARVILDIDGVLADLVSPLIQRGLPIPLDYGFSNYTAEERLLVRDLIHDPAFLSSLEPLSGAEEGLYRILNTGAEIAFLTSRPQIAERETRSWIVRNFPLVPWFEEDIPLYFSQDKGEWISRNASYWREPVFVVEDAPHQAVSAVSAGARVVYLVDHPYNRTLTAYPSGLLRVASLEEASVHLSALLLSPVQGEWE